MTLIKRRIVGEGEDADRLAPATAVELEREVAPQPGATRRHREDVERRPIVRQRASDRVRRVLTAATRPTSAGPLIPAAAASSSEVDVGATGKIAAGSTSSTSKAAWTTSFST